MRIVIDDSKCAWDVDGDDEGARFFPRVPITGTTTIDINDMVKRKYSHVKAEENQNDEDDDDNDDDPDHHLIIRMNSSG
jgi:hypothetical protein